MKCDFCNIEFIDNHDGLTTKIFHEIIHHTKEIKG